MLKDLKYRNLTQRPLHPWRWNRDELDQDSGGDKFFSRSSDQEQEALSRRQLLREEDNLRPHLRDLDEAKDLLNILQWILVLLPDGRTIALLH